MAQFHLFPSLIEKRSYMVALFVFLFTFGVYVVSPLTTSTDSKWTFHLSASILQQHDTDLDEYVHLIPSNDYRILKLDGHIYSYFPVATSYLITPMTWIINKYFEFRYSISFYEYLNENRPDKYTARIEKWLSSFFCAISAAFIYLLSLRRVNIGSSTFITFVFAFCTSMWSTVSRALWQHSLSVLLLLLGLFLITEDKKRSSSFVLTGLLFSIAFLVRPVNSISLFFVTLYLILNHREYLTGYVIALLVPLLLFFAQNLEIYGAVIPPYFEPQRLGGESNILEAMFGNLFSPARGLFVFSPVLLFSLLGIKHNINVDVGIIKNISVFLLAIIVTHLIVISSFHPWYGGWTIGPRFTSDILPYLFFFFIRAYEIHIVTLRHKFLRAVLLILILTSFCIHFLCIRSDYSFSWNGKPEIISDAPNRVWDWGDLQFMRGLCPKEPNAPAPDCWLK